MPIIIQILSLSSCAFLHCCGPERGMDYSPSWQQQVPPYFSPGGPGPACGFLGFGKPRHLGLLGQKPYLPDWMFRVSSLLSLRENSISQEGARALAQALCMNNTLKHLEYVMIGLGGGGGQRETVLPHLLRHQGWWHHCNGLDPGHPHSSQGWARNSFGKGQPGDLVSLVTLTQELHSLPSRDG